MRRSSFAWSLCLHMAGVVWLLILGQHMIKPHHLAVSTPIVAQIVPAQVLATQIDKVEKSTQAPKPAAKPLRKSAAIAPVKKPPAPKPAAKPLPKPQPPLPVFTAHEREQFLQSALEAEADAYQVALRAEAARIGQEIKRIVSANWLIPVGRSHDLQCQVKIQLDTVGTVQHVTIIQSSGDGAFDDAAMSAVQRSSPLPMPQDRRFLSQFREILLTLSPDGVG